MHSSLNRVFLRLLNVVVMHLTVSPCASYIIGEPIPEKEPKIPLSALFSNPVKDSPQISPDGMRLAYLASVNNILNIWISTLAGGDDAHPVTTQDVRDIRAYSWARDNVHFLFLQDTKGDENYHVYKVHSTTQVVTDLTPFAGVKSFVIAYNDNDPSEILIGMNKDDARFFDVYRLNIETGECMLDTKNPGGVIGWIADHNFCIRIAEVINSDGSKSLLYRKERTDAWHELMRWEWQERRAAGGIGFSSDNNRFYYLDPSTQDTAFLMELNLETQEKKVIASDIHYDMHAENIIFDTHHQLAFFGIEKERMAWYASNSYYTELLALMSTIDKGDLFFCNSSYLKGSKQYWVIGFNHDNCAPSFYLFDENTHSTTFLFDAKPILKEYNLVPMTPIQFTARDGLTIHGYLTLPGDKPVDQPIPLVLLVHGGPWLRDSWGYSRFVQLIARRGYGCLQLNYRGSNGYGKSFLNAGNKEWGGKMHDDLIDGVQWAIESGIADPRKIAIMGGSYGGYAALVGATFTPDTFCCAIDIVGISSLVSFIQTIPPYWTPFLKEYSLRIGDLATEREFLESRSPLFKIDAIKIPLLIIQGAHDPRVKRSESDQIVAAMRAKNLDVEYVLIEDEGHGWTGQKNHIAQAETIDAFLARYL